MGRRAKMGTAYVSRQKEGGVLWGKVITRASAKAQQQESSRMSKRHRVALFGWRTWKT